MRAHQYHRTSEKVQTCFGVKFLKRVGVSLKELMGTAKEGLLAFSVAAGLKVLRSMMEAGGGGNNWVQGQASW